jgi:hypothetical protein
LQVKLVESGPLLVWSDRGSPRAKGVEVKSVGASLYRIELPVAGATREITLSR